MKHLLIVGSEVFSAVTVFSGRVGQSCITMGTPTQQSSNICHEVSHGLLHHPPTAAMDNSGCRASDQTLRMRLRRWLAGCSGARAGGAGYGQGAMDLLRSGRPVSGVSEPMLRFRLNATGAVVRARRAAKARR